MYVYFYPNIIKKWLNGNTNLGEYLFHYLIIYFINFKYSRFYFSSLNGQYHILRQSTLENYSFDKVHFSDGVVAKSPEMKNQFPSWEVFNFLSQLKNKNLEELRKKSKQ